jgi:WXG100 family type VII secretion target
MDKKIQARYEELDQLAARLHQEGDRVEVLFRNMRVKSEQLSGSWLGEGSMAFQRVMEEEILPGVKRLATSLEVAGRFVVEIIRTFRDAEREAAALLPRVERLVAGHSAAKTWKDDEYLVRDPNSLFKDEYMDGLVGSRFQGAGGEMRNAMNDLLKDPDGVELDQTLHRIAELRGRPFSEMKTEYDKFIELRKERNAAKADPVSDLNQVAHPWFMGSNTQLRYGEVVGEAFGIDPVFAAMLNPTGGIVGPDNKGLPGDDTALGYHGVVHDAAGYLYTYHGVGPGYNYLGLEDRDTGDPLTGQRTGIAHWIWKVGRYNPVNYVTEGGVVIGIGGVDAHNKFHKWVKGIFQ